MALTPEQRDAIRSDLKWLITRSGLTAADVGGFLDPPMSARGVQFWVQAGRPTLDHCDQIQGLAKRLRNGAEVERLTAELAEYERDDRERTERHMAERRAAERAGGLGDATPRLREQAFAELREVRAELAQARQRNEVLEKLLGAIWLYVNWRYVTTQLTTPQKELWVDAVNVTADPDDDGWEGPDRWWALTGQDGDGK